MSSQAAFLQCVCLRNLHEVRENSSQMTSKKGPWRFLTASPVPAVRGHNLFYGFFYGCLFFRLTQIALQNVQLPELWAPSKLDLNPGTYGWQVDKPWGNGHLLPHSLCVTCRILWFCNELPALSSPSPISFLSAPGTEKGTSLRGMETTTCTPGTLVNCLYNFSPLHKMFRGSQFL